MREAVKAGPRPKRTPARAVIRKTETDCGPIDVRVGQLGNTAGAEQLQQVQSPVRDRQAEHAADAREDRRFRE